MLRKDIVYYGLIKGFTMLFWIILLKLNSKYLTPSEFGNFSISLNIAIVIAILITGWQNASLLRFYHENNKVNLFSIIIRETVKYCLIISLIMFISIIVVWNFFSLTYALIGLNALFLSISYALFLILATLFRIKRELKKYLLMTILFFIISLFIYFILINMVSWQTGLISMSFAYIMIILINVINKKDNVIMFMKYIFDTEYKTILMNYGLPIILIGISSQLLSTSDILILKFYGYDNQVGIYSANYSIAEKSIFAILSIMVSAFTPIVFKKIEEDKFDVLIEIKKVVNYFLIVSIPIVIVMFIFSKDICMLFLSKNYIEGDYIIPFISLSGIFVGVASFYSEILTVSKQTKLLAKLYVIAFVFNLVLNLLFIKQYGMQAALVSTIMSYMLLMVIIIIYSKEKIHV